MAEVPHYRLHCEAKLLLIELPLVFCNNGDEPVVIENLRLRFGHEGKDATPIRFNSTEERLSGPSKHIDWAQAFAIPCGETKELICQFQRCPSNFQFEAEPTQYKIELDALIMGCWATLREYTLSVPMHKLKEVSEISAIMVNTSAIENPMQDSHHEQDHRTHLPVTIKITRDFSNWVVNEQRYQFNRRQSQVMKALYEEWKESQSGLLESFILEEILDTPNHRLLDTFRKNPAWEKLLYAKKGQVYLLIPENADVTVTLSAE